MLEIQFEYATYSLCFWLCSQMSFVVKESQSSPTLLAFSFFLPDMMLIHIMLSISPLPNTLQSLPRYHCCCSRPKRITFEGKVPVPKGVVETADSIDEIQEIFVQLLELNKSLHGQSYGWQRRRPGMTGGQADRRPGEGGNKFAEARRLYSYRQWIYKFHVNRNSQP